MTHKLAHLVPAFLKRIDQYLLLHFPALWASKFHFVLFYGLISALGIGLISLVPLSPFDLPDPEVQFGLACIPAVLGFLFWGWHVGRLNGERHFGTTSLLQRFGLQGVYLFCIAVFASLPFLYGQSVAYRGAHSMSSEQLVSHINAYHLVQDFVYESNSSYYYHFDLYEDIMSLEDRDFMRGWMVEADKKQTLQEYFALIELYTEEELSSAAKKRIRESFSQPQHRATVYGNQLSGLSYAQHLIDQTRDGLDDIASHKLHWADQSWGFQQVNPMGRSMRDLDHVPIAVGLVLFYFFLSLMLFVRQGGKNFFLSLLVGAGVLILSSFTFVIAESTILDYSEEEPFLGAMYFIGMGLLALFAFVGGQRKKLAFWRSAALMIITAMTPMVLLFSYMSVDALNGDVTPTHVFGWGILIAFVLWNVALERRFIGMHAAPSRD